MTARAQDVVQTWTEAGEIFTRLIDCHGRITEWGPEGMLCRRGCGSLAAIGTGGQCASCDKRDDFMPGDIPGGSR